MTREKQGPVAGDVKATAVVTAPGTNKGPLLEQLTGVNSSKLSYYVELKQRSQELWQQNRRLQLLQQLSRDLNIDLSIEAILQRVYGRLPEALPCDFVGLVSLQAQTLQAVSQVPGPCLAEGAQPADSRLWALLQGAEACAWDPRQDSAFQNRSPQAPVLSALVAAPLLQQGAVTDLLLVGSVRPDAYTAAEFSFVQHLADQLAISLRNARLYEQVSRARRQWESTFRAVTDPIFLIDFDYRVLQHNKRLPREVLSDWHAALEARSFAALRGGLEPGGECPLQQLRRTEQSLYRRWQTESGRLLDLYFYPVHSEQQLTGATVLIKDVTEKTKLEAQVVQSAKLAALGEMAAGVAHELNSPMTVILGTAQLLARELPPEDAAAADDIISCGRRCKQIIQNLLTFSRQDKQPVEEVDLNAEVARVLSLIQYQINREQIEIREQLDPALPTIRANGPQLQQVLTNLLINARDALSERGAEAAPAAEGRWIAVRTARRDCAGQAQVVLSVEDNGCGIAEADLSKIFAPFYTSKDATKGTGLGLSVSLGIAEAHGGMLEVRSQPGAGSCFSLILPLAPPPGLSTSKENIS